MTLYVDLIYLSCVVMNFVMLYFHSLFLSVKIKKRKLLLGALSGGFLSIQAIVFDIGLILILAQTILILRLLYGRCSVAEFIRRIVILIGIMLVFGAVFNLFSVFHIGVFVKKNKMYGVLPLYIFILAAIFASFIIFVFLFFIRNKKQLFKIQIVIDDEVIKTTAFSDSGNRLREPKSQRPVIIIEDKILQCGHNRESIFLKTVGSECECIDMVHVKSLTFLDENREIYDLYAGIAKHPLSKNGEFCVLLHSELAN